MSFPRYTYSTNASISSCRKHASRCGCFLGYPCSCMILLRGSSSTTMCKKVNLQKMIYRRSINHETTVTLIYPCCIAYIIFNYLIIPSSNKIGYCIWTFVFCVKIETHLGDSLYPVEMFLISPEHSGAYHFQWFPERKSLSKKSLHIHAVQISLWEENWVFNTMKN